MNGKSHVNSHEHVQGDIQAVVIVCFAAVFECNGTEILKNSGKPHCEFDTAPRNSEFKLVVKHYHI
jgi:hypothetical protein